MRSKYDLFKIDSVIEQKENLLERLLQMITAFQIQTKKANALLSKYFQLDNPMYWRQASIPQSGYCNLEKSIRYYYHGIGCKVESKDLTIDWDYGFDGRTDGFDLWRLQIFAQNSTNDFPEFRNKKILEVIFQEAKDRKLIARLFKDQQDDLFYLNDNH